MALKTSLRLVARRIAEAVRRYAAAQGLPPGDYALTGTYDGEADRISLTLGADRPIDERRWYAGILQEIRKSFPEAPHLTMHIGLVVRTVQNLDDVYLESSPGADEIDLTELLQGS